jgi:hypothetical protein
MAKSKKADADVPTFTLRADDPRHLTALIALSALARTRDETDVFAAIREFELYEEAHR